MGLFAAAISLIEGHIAINNHDETMDTIRLRYPEVPADLLFQYQGFLLNESY